MNSAESIAEAFGVDPVSAALLARASMVPLRLGPRKRIPKRFIEEMEKTTRYFENTGDPEVMMNLFIQALDRGMSPPLPVLEALAKGFKGHLEDGQKDALSKMLGLKRSRGQREVSTPEARRKREQDHFHLAKEMFWLRYYFKATREDLKVLVHWKTKKDGYGPNRIPIKNEDHLLQIYDRQKWPQQELQRHEGTGKPSAYAMLPAEFKSPLEFLESFPEVSATKGILAKLKENYARMKGG